jgi:hypothetical protein
MPQDVALIVIVVLSVSLLISIFTRPQSGPPPEILTPDEKGALISFRDRLDILSGRCQGKWSIEKLKEFDKRLYDLEKFVSPYLGFKYWKE